MSEHKLQVAVAKMLDASGLLWTAIPNGGKRSAITGAMLKAEGVKAGCPDIMILEERKYPNGRIYPVEDYFHALFIELKNGKAGRVSPAQREWIDVLNSRGYRAEVCRSLDEVIALLRECYPDRFP